MGKRKTRKMMESDDDFGFEDGMDDTIKHDDFDDSNRFHTEDDSDDDQEGSEEDIQEGAHDDNDEDGEMQKGGELEQLEKELEELKKQQDIWRNLMPKNDVDVKKGQAVKNQRALWDKALELRFLVQKAFTNSNRLPQEPARSSFCNTDSRVSEAYSDLIATSEKTLDAMLNLQQALLKNNPSISQPGKDSKKPEASGYDNDDIDEEWLQISQMQSGMASFRNKSIDKWQRKTEVTTGAAVIKNKLRAFNQSISEQVAGYMRDPSKMIEQMQPNRSAVAVFGTHVPDSTDNTNQEENYVNGDPELLDDSEFYQHLLKEFFETIDPSSSETAFYTLKRLQTKKRKIVDRRASKSRKIRYHVHEKLVNFMAPRPVNLPPTDAKLLFEDLFGLKSRQPAPGA